MTGQSRRPTETLSNSFDFGADGSVLAVGRAPQKGNQEGRKRGMTEATDSGTSRPQRAKGATATVTSPPLSRGRPDKIGHGWGLEPGGEIAAAVVKRELRMTRLMAARRRFLHGGGGKRRANCDKCSKWCQWLSRRRRRMPPFTLKSKIIFNMLNKLALVPEGT